MYTVFTLIVIFVVHNQAVPYETLIQEEWGNFKLKHEKNYNSEIEENYRKKIFMQNLHIINEHNTLYEMKLSSYEMGMNQFGDLLEHEFMDMYNMSSDYVIDLGDDLSESSNGFFIYAPPSNVNVSELSQTMDWRERGAVTGVKNQGKCGSCWSFSATGVLEGQWFRKTRQLISLSEQNLMDCSWNYNNNACEGGLAIWALEYINRNGGIDSESSYGYKGQDSHQCKYSSRNKVASVKKVVLVPQSEDELMQKVNSVGPMAISMTVSPQLRFYHRGVFNDPNCGTHLGHAVLAVGYGTEKGSDYWLVKNSWGRYWGEAGYLKMSRNKNNQCGIANRISYPLV